MFSRRSAFLDADEIGFYQSLAIAVGNRGHVSCKTRAINVVDVDKASANLSQAIRLNLKTIHFLVCDRDRFQPLLAIQVCRGTSGSDVKADPFLVAALKTANLPLLTVNLSAQPSVEILQKTLAPLFTRLSLQGNQDPKCGDRASSAEVKKRFSDAVQSVDLARVGPPRSHADPANVDARKK